MGIPTAVPADRSFARATLVAARRLALTLIAFGALGSGPALALASEAWVAPSVVTITIRGAKEGPYSPSHLTWRVIRAGGDRSSLLLREGDDGVDRAGESWSGSLESESGGSRAAVTLVDGMVRHGTKTLTVDLDEEAARAWVMAASDEHLAGLRTLHLGLGVDSEKLRALKRIAAANPEVAIIVGSNESLQQALAHLSPRAIIGLDGKADDPPDWSVLAEQPQIETLGVIAPNADDLKVLAKLPNLKRLWIRDWDVAEAGPLPKGLSALKSIEVIGDPITDLSGLRHVPGSLEELCLIGTADDMKATGIRQFKRLRVFIGAGFRDSKLAPLEKAPGGGWVSLPLSFRDSLWVAAAYFHPSGAFDVMGAVVEPAAVLLNDGDHVGVALFDEGRSPWPPFRYRAGDGVALDVILRDGIVELAGSTVSIALKSEEARAWVTDATDAQIAELRSVGIGGADDAADAEKELAALRRIAVVNPKVDLVVAGAEPFPAALALLQPRAIIHPLDSEVELDWSAVANRDDIDTLTIWGGIQAPGVLPALGTLHGLRRLWTSTWDVEALGPLPEGLDALSSLVLHAGSGTITDLAGLVNIPASLKELSLLKVSAETDLSGIERFTGLRTLLLSGDEAPDLFILNGLADLRWVGLPSGTDPDQLAALAAAHPALEVLQLGTDRCEAIDLEPLSSLEDLQALVLLGDTSEDVPYKHLSTLRGLKSLRYVAFSWESLEESSDETAAIREDLPDATIVVVAPRCLGSGWILLLLPVLVVAWLRARRQGLIASAA